MRTASQWLSLLYDQHGNIPTYFPEGVRPLPSDDLQRIYQKIVFLEDAGVVGGGGGSIPCTPPLAPGTLILSAAGAFVINTSWADNGGSSPGSLLDFDGSGARLVIPNSASLNITTGLTVEAWIYARNATVYAFFEKTVGGVANTSFSIFLNVGFLFFRLVKGAALTDIISDAAFPVNTLTHVAATWDGTTMKLYINGVLQASTAALAAPIDTGAGDSFIGPIVSWFPLDGQIDEVRVWNIGRTQAEILAWKNMALFGTEPGLAAYWRLDENTGLSAFDASGNENTGTLTAGPTWQPSSVVLARSWPNETGFDIRWRNITTGSGFTNEPSNAENDVTAQITVTGATAGDTIEVQVRASGASCDSAWISDTVIIT